MRQSSKFIGGLFCLGWSLGALANEVPPQVNPELKRLEGVYEIIPDNQGDPKSCEFRAKITGFREWLPGFVAVSGTNQVKVSLSLKTVRVFGWPFITTHQIWMLNLDRLGPDTDSQYGLEYRNAHHELPVTPIFVEGLKSDWHPSRKWQVDLAIEDGKGGTFFNQMEWAAPEFGHPLDVKSHGMFLREDYFEVFYRASYHFDWIPDSRGFCRLKRTSLSDPRNEDRS